LQSDADRFSVSNGSGRLDVVRILPEHSLIRLIGGKGFEYYVEDDGDDASLNGHNFAAGATEKPWFDLGKWRVEIQPRQAGKTHHFLIALSPSIGVDRSREVSAIDVGSETGRGLATDQSIVLFPDEDGHAKYRFRLPAEQKRIIIVGVVVGTSIEVSSGSMQKHQHRVIRSGVIDLTLPAGSTTGSDIQIEF
jgi:hypothetical protein